MEHLIRIEFYATAASIEAMQARIDNETPLDILCAASGVNVEIVSEQAAGNDEPNA